MAFTKITAAGIGSTETVTLDGLTVINNVSIGGTLTYEDVTNIDSVGLITARAGVVVGSGITLSKDGDIFATGVTTSTTFVGNLTGNADTATNSTNSSHILVTDNESTNENNLITFVEDATSSTGNVGLEMDGNLTYNPSTGTVSATAFSGDGSALTGIGGTDFIHSEQINNSGVTTTGSAVVGGGVTISESGIEASGIGITVANINGGAIGGRRNILINGAMLVAQRGTSSTSSGYATIDRFQSGSGNIGQNVTQSQQSLSSSDTGPYGEGFRKYKRAQLAAAGNANANAYVEAATYKVEAQDLANSGWDPASATNFITLSFWFRCSTNQTFLLNLRSEDGTSRMFSTTFTASANNTWTKIVKTIPGNTSPTVDIDNDNGSGLAIFWVPFYGTDYTDSGSTMDAWKTYSGSSQGTDMASTWLAAGASTFDLTGVQLEVGSQATAFEHRHFGEERLLCQRYYQDIAGSSDLVMFGSGRASGTTNALVSTPLSVPLRASPTISQTNYSTWGTEGSHTVTNTTPTVQYFWTNNTFLPMNFHSTASLTNARVATVSCNGGSSLIMDAEL